jgi:hypothetical protein
MPYLEKEKYSESLVEKLLDRINSKNIIECRNVALILTYLAYNEKSIRKLTEEYDKYREMLKDAFINKQFQDILTKIKKNAKIEIKTLVDELEQKIMNYQIENFDKRKEPESKKRLPQKKGNRGRNAN